MTAKTKVYVFFPRNDFWVYKISLEDYTIQYPKLFMQNAYHKELAINSIKVAHYQIEWQKTVILTNWNTYTHWHSEKTKQNNINSYTYTHKIYDLVHVIQIKDLYLRYIQTYTIENWNGWGRFEIPKVDKKLYLIKCRSWIRNLRRFSKKMEEWERFCTSDLRLWQFF